MEAQLGEERVDRADLDAPTSARAAQGGRLDVVRAVRNDERQGSEGLDNPWLGTGTAEALQEFLQDQSRREHEVVVLEGPAQGADLGRGGWRIATEGK